MFKDLTKSRIQRDLVGFICFCILLFFDLYTKNLADCYLKGTDGMDVIKGVFRLQYLENTGAAFSLFTGKIVFFYIITVILCAIILRVLFLLPSDRHFYPFFYALVVLLSGAVGNFIDRILHQYVIDFLYFSLIDFPIFNMADIYVTTSVFFLFLLLMFFYKDEELSAVFQRKSK